MYGSESLDDLVLDILVPQASKYDVEDIINSTEVSELDEVDESSWFPSVAQRGVLYFGKLLLEAYADCWSYSLIGTY